MPLQLEVSEKLARLKALGSSCGCDCVRCAQKVRKNGHCECGGCARPRHHVSDAGARAAVGVGGGES